uniref:Mating pheromone 4 n=1 Tax=Euplotoides octocarinatus TaxID=2716877 RepID=MER4_EUPOC|nr:RecName: Full=Mating pheromone 4; Flags: Precursor [Euplotes octocarinatus]CAA41646.1 pheromone 4 precursor [Euplotes octocarinatus]CAA41647.1 pheromone 4 precursor [Euplotes octocarinatus]
MKAIFIILAILMVTQAFKMTSKVKSMNMSRNMSKNTSTLGTKYTYGCPQTNTPTQQDCYDAMYYTFMAMCDLYPDPEHPMFPSYDSCQEESDSADEFYTNQCGCGGYGMAAAHDQVCLLALGVCIPE